ncbi:MAG TPA: hypothetical protein VF120_09740, partial [Ktedonobacterales bacterium]
RQTITPRTLVVSFGGIPSRDVRPGDIADETYADGRFCRMAREQAEGTYNVGGMVAVCPACAATLLRPLPDNLGMIVGFTRQVFPTRMTDIVLGHGKPGPEEPAGSIIVGADAGELIPDLENHLAQLARQHLATTPKRIFSWEVLP